MRRACDLCPRMKNRLDKGALSPSQFCRACFQIDMSFSSKEIINDGVVSAAGSLDYNRTEILLWSFLVPLGIIKTPGSTRGGKKPWQIKTSMLR